ncbi:CRISPR-associated protein Cas3 [Thermoclostridium stercorarium subsp. leptospartum DSM 9219]|uniref:CRISPR-associated protein Cas3 n=1 Tax=Thermoclostridium stercorarium subsp. leptospartum DSM 9219 TaxID=1346611 RepID=A0A1B1YLY6_THEST|nr:CRISPR-associated helicase/endonuclease Cas3 [Thermoclostridium stercorarium]ANX01736.1 CRISPR-associated protein Cas3 [Thermoclostridium stercorarium subsp. leptospartum DSM 9219]
MEYYAKLNPTQTILEHTQKALELYKQLKLLYSRLLSNEEWELLELAIICHDLGKTNAFMQKFFYQKLNIPFPLALEHNIPQIYHNHLSCAFIDYKDVISKYGLKNYKILCNCIYYHHNRPETDKKVLKYYIKNCLPNDIENFNFPLLAYNLRSKLNCEFTPYIDIYNNGLFTDFETFKRYVMIKGLLHKVDYCASAGIDIIEDNTRDEDGLSAAKKIKCIYPNLRDIQIYMNANKDKNLIIVGSTGIGKTEGAILWIGEEKGFYTLPLQIANNSIYARIKDKIKYKNVKLLHSNAISTYIREEKENGNTDAQEEYQKAKLFSSPLTVCTVDQIFKFVFKYNGFEYLLATLAYSKIVIDEIQMYSPEIVASILYGLKLATGLGSKFAIITATFPPILGDLMERYKIPFKGPVFFHKPGLPTRHRIKFFENRDFDLELIIDLAERYKVLIITNTVSKAQKIYEKLKDKVNTWIIHSRYIRKHRRMLENKILEFAPNKKDRNSNPGVWVSTHVVEASLDIDFDYILTSMCSIESLIQRMGRVWRDRLYDAETPNVYIYDNHDGLNSVIDSQIYSFSCNAVKAYDGKLLYETDIQNDKQAMMEMVYDRKKNPDILSSEYFKEIVKRIDSLDNLLPYDLKIKEVVKLFRGINSITIIPSSIYSELKKSGKISEWEYKLNQNISMKEKQSIKDEINEYTLELPWYDKGNLIIQENIIYPHSDINLWNGEYDFDENTLKGIGLI